MFREFLTPSRILGVAVSVTGLVLIGSLTDGSAPIHGFFLVLLGGLAWGVSNTIVKMSKARDSLSFLVWSCLFASIPLFIMGYTLTGTEEILAPQNSINAWVILALFVQSYIATVLAYVVWNSLIVKYDLSQVAPLSLAVPVFGILGSVIFFAEPLGLFKLFAIFLVLFGLAICFKGERILNVCVALKSTMSRMRNFCAWEKVSL